MADAPANQNQWSAWKEWETLKLDKNGTHPEIGLLTLNRPDRRNAVNTTMMNDFHECLDFLNHAFDCRVVILTGAGKMFCAGLDLSQGFANDPKLDWTIFPDKVKSLWQMQHEVASIIPRLRRIPQPVITAVHGAAVGDGMALTNASDIVVAAKGTRFINAFIKIGLSGADCGSSYFLPRILGLHRTAELMYSGRDFLAEEAYQWGYVNFLVDKPEETVPRAVEFAAEYMLTKSPLGLRFTKEALNFNVDSPSLEAAVKFEDRNQTLAAQTEDAMEGIIAFFEKRKPKYGSR